MMDQWEQQHPARIEQIFSALQNVAPSQLADPKLFDFAALGARGGASAGWLMPGPAADD